MRPTMVFVSPSAPLLALTLCALLATGACVTRQVPPPASAPVPAAAVVDTRPLYDRISDMGTLYGRSSARRGGQVWEQRWLAAMTATMRAPLRDTQRLARVTWGQFVHGAAGLKGRALLDYVQDEWGAMYCTDPRGESLAAWVPPSRLAQERSGTSADLAVAKYVTLRALRWPASRVWVAGLGDASGRTLLVACAVDDTGLAWVLDPEQGLSAAYPLAELKTRRPGLVPVFALGEEESVAFSGSGAASTAAARSSDPLAENALPQGAFSAPLVPMGGRGVMSLSGAQRAAEKGRVEGDATPGMIDTGVRGAHPSAPILDLKPGMPVK